MSKKKIFKIGVIALFVLSILYVAIFFEPIQVKDVKLSFDITIEEKKDDVIQIFYLDYIGDDFSEEYTVLYPIEEGNNNITFSLNEVETLRIDFGNNVATYNIENMKFTMGIFESLWTEDDWNAMHVSTGIESHKFLGDRIQLVSNTTDPYIVWHVNDFGLEERFDQTIYLANLCIRLFTTFVLVVILFVVVKKFEFFVEFPTEIWRSRCVLLQFAKNDFKTRFAGSYLGIFWAFVQPVVTVLVYWFVFEKGLRSGAVLNVPFALWLIAGIVPWFFFSDSLNAGTNALLEYQYLVKKVVFQISVLPLVKVISNFFVHIAFVLFAIILFATYGYYPDWYFLQIIYYSLCTFVLVLGLSYATSALVGFFRDLSQIINIILQIGIWMTPIMWNMETMDVPEGLKIFLKANPMYYIVSGYRDAFINKVWFWENMGQTVYFWVVVLIILGSGMIIFKRLKPHLADVL